MREQVRETLGELCVIIFIMLMGWWLIASYLQAFDQEIIVEQNIVSSYKK